MRHVNLSLREWVWSTDPFPAYRVSLWYGRNQWDKKFIGVNNITPDESGTLPQDAFHIVKTKEGTIVLTAGKDTTSRCLLFVGCGGGFRGGVEILDEATTGRVLMVCSASNACQDEMQIAALLDVGQSVGFYSHGRRTNDVIVHTWDGSQVQTKCWTRRQWDRRNDPPRSEENVSWMPGNFRIVQLSGDEVAEGVTLERGELAMPGAGRVAHGFNIPMEETCELKVVRFGNDMHDELVIAPAKPDEPMETDHCAVLIHEYTSGCGHKRWPSFHIDWDHAGPNPIEKIGGAYRGSGSGSDTYTLILVPTGWAENIAAQFVNERDKPSQTIGFVPGAKRQNTISRDGSVTLPSPVESGPSAMALAFKKAGL
jgi:hypothetical protein